MWVNKWYQILIYVYCEHHDGCPKTERVTSKGHLFKVLRVHEVCWVMLLRNRNSKGKYALKEIETLHAWLVSRPSVIKNTEDTVIDLLSKSDS